MKRFPASVLGLALGLSVAGLGTASPAEPEVAPVDSAAANLPAVGGVDGPATFERLTKLVGEWKGSWEPGSVATTVTYSLTGNGSVLVEDYLVGDTTMSTLYHLDGDRLMLTHYCSVGNQPRMRATSVNGEGRVVFDAFDVTNVGESGGYSERLVVELQDANRISVAYTGSRTGRTSGVELERVR